MSGDEAGLDRLLARTALGDRRAFAALYAATAARLFPVSMRIVRERQLAEEVLQDSFVSVWNRASSYARERGTPLTWMAAILRNRSLDVVRRTREDPDVDDERTASLADESASPAREAEARAGAHSLARCLAELEGAERQAVALAFFHGLTHAELAAHLRSPLGTVKTRVRRALARLRDCLLRGGATAPG
jgi:RNA polymerase sigma-70 factor (ECF subfamily)